jgi:Tfp pilus assembly protein PilV
MRRPTARARGGGAAGFNLIEVLVATALLFIVAIGVIPLFSRAMIANKVGSDATTVSHFGLSRVEELNQPPFNSPVMEPAVVDEYYSKADETWRPGVAPSDDPATWTRTTEITQYAYADFKDDMVLDDPLPAGAPSTDVHIKLIEVEVRMERREGNPINRRRDLDLRTVRPY